MENARIIIDWRDAESGDRWDYCRALYAILHPDESEVLYLGKADGCTIRQRWRANDKHERVWKRIECERRLFQHRFIVGEFRIPVGTRFTQQLLSDIESLLIQQLQPWANTQCTKSRGYSRPGMVVFCQGAWPLRRKTFRDE